MQMKVGKIVYQHFGARREGKGCVEDGKEIWNRWSGEINGEVERVEEFLPLVSPKSSYEHERRPKDGA
jgi:hypothetical protein